MVIKSCLSWRNKNSFNSGHCIRNAITGVIISQSFKSSKDTTYSGFGGFVRIDVFSHLNGDDYRNDDHNNENDEETDPALLACRTC